MGRKKIETENKKVRLSVTIEPKLERIIKNNHINFSSLVNKLLKEYFDEKNKNMSSM